MLATKEKNEIKRIVPMYDDPLLKTGSINYTELYIRAFKKVQENGLKEDKEKEHQRAETKGVVVLYARVNDRVIVLNDPVNWVDPLGLYSFGEFFNNYSGVFGGALMSAGGALITLPLYATSPVWAPTVGAGLFVGGATLAIYDWYSSTQKAIEKGDKIRKTLQERLRELEEAQEQLECRIK